MEEEGLLNGGDRDPDEGRETGHDSPPSNAYEKGAEAAMQSEARIRKYMRDIDDATMGNTSNDMEGEEGVDGGKVSDGTKTTAAEGLDKMQDDLGDFIDSLENDAIDVFDDGGQFATQEEIDGEYIEDI